jgi:hypothetical protein
MRDIERQELAKKLLKKSSDVFYDIVPEKYKTYCVLVSSIAKFAIQANGLNAKLTACQVWYTNAETNYAIGFTGVDKPGKWDGHVICSSNGYFIDASTSQLKIKDSEVPEIVFGPLMPKFSTVLARYSIDRERSVWWHQVSKLRSIEAIPTEPHELVSSYGKLLAERIQAEM